MMSLVSVKNHRNALHNPYAQYPKRLTVEDVLNSEMISYPLTREQICTMSDGAACVILCDEARAKEFTDKPVQVTGVGCGTDTMRLADRPFGKVPLLPHEKAKDYENLPYPGSTRSAPGVPPGSRRTGWRGSRSRTRSSTSSSSTTPTPRARSRPTRTSVSASTARGTTFVERGDPFLKGIDYGFPVPRAGADSRQPLRRSHRLRPPGRGDRPHAGRLRLLAAPGNDPKHFGDPTLQLANPRRGAIHSHAGTGSAVTVSILERGFR